MHVEECKVMRLPQQVLCQAVGSLWGLQIREHPEELYVVIFYPMPSILRQKENSVIF